MLIASLFHQRLQNKEIRYMVTGLPPTLVAVSGLKQIFEKGNARQIISSWNQTPCLPAIILISWLVDE